MQKLFAVLFWAFFTLSVPVNSVTQKSENAVQALKNTVLDTAVSYIGTREIGKNAGPAVERFLKSVNTRVGQPYCAAFVSYCLTQGKAKSPKTRSALARNFKLKNSIKAIDVLHKNLEIPAGTIVGWEKGKTISGHLGFVRNTFSGRKLTTVEANTGPDDKGNQRDGDGVWKRRRTIAPYAHFRITFFTKVEI